MSTFFSHRSLDAKDSPIQIRSQRIQRERRLVVLILLPDRMIALAGGGGEVEVDADDEHEQPGDDGEDLVGGEGLRAVRFLFGEGVHWRGKVLT